MPKTRWKPFPYPHRAYNAGTRLNEHWPRLHNGDREPFPALGDLKKLVDSRQELAPAGSLEQATSKLQDAWRAYHRGDFGEAVEELGLAVGPLGYSVANKAANIYATYLETSKSAKLALFLNPPSGPNLSFARASSLVNAWYFHAQALGRYSQGISVVKAFSLVSGAGRQSQSQLGPGDPT